MQQLVGKSLPHLAHFSIFCAEGEVKMYRTYREILNYAQNISLIDAKLLPVRELLAGPCIRCPNCSDCYDIADFLLYIFISYQENLHTPPTCENQNQNSRVTL